jgi:ATP-dependent helicase YprA (DUF1998 family)
MAKATKQADNTAAIQAKLTEWYTLAQQVVALADQEKALRKEIFDLAFPKPKPGTSNRFPLGFGKDLQADYRLNYKVDKEAMAEARANIPEDVFNEVIKFRPEVSGSKYRGLSDNMKGVFAGFITETPGTPGLEIVPVKGRGR